MKERNTYSRIIQDLEAWSDLSKGAVINLFHYSVEKDITSFLINFSDSSNYQQHLGTAFSESGLSRDEIQILATPENHFTQADDLIAGIEKILELMDTDYLDLLFLDLRMPHEEIVRAVAQLRAQEKVVEIGIREERPGEKSDFLKDFPASAILSNFRFTPGAMKTLTLAEAASQETTQMIIPVSGEWENEHEQLNLMAAKYQLRPKELLFAWLLAHELHFHPVIKGNSEAVIDSAVKAFRTSIIDEDFKKLLERL